MKKRLVLNTVFCTCCTGHRAHEAELLCKSILRLYPRAEIVVDAIDFDIQQVKRLKSLGVLVNLISSKPKWSELEKGVAVYNKEYRQGLKGHRYKGHVVPLYCSRTYEACFGNLWRMFMLPRVMEDYLEGGDDFCLDDNTDFGVMWLDTDTMFRKPIDSMISKVSKHDLAIIGRPTMPKYARYLAALYRVRATKKGREWLRRSEEIAHGLQGLAWTINQLSLRLAAEEVEPLVYELSPSVFSDCMLRSASRIWHIKHNKKKDFMVRRWEREAKRLGLL